MIFQLSGNSRVAFTALALCALLCVPGLASGLGHGLDAIPSAALRAAALAWLLVWSCGFLLALGSLFWSALHHITRSSWNSALLPRMARFASLLPWCALAALPFFLPQVQAVVLASVQHPPAFAPGSAAARWLPSPDILAHPLVLNLRLLFCLTASLLASGLLRLRPTPAPAPQSLSSTTPSNSAPSSPSTITPAQPAQSLPLHIPQGQAALVLVLLTLTIAVWSNDWLLSLHAHWVSSIWPVAIFASSALASLAALGSPNPDPASRGRKLHCRLLLAFCLFWAYISYSQYMLVWFANLPEESSFFVRPDSLVSAFSAPASLALCFALPFVLLVAAPSKLRHHPLFLPSIHTSILTGSVFHLLWVIPF